jgi:peptidyl-tRNA hydrolase
MDDIEKRSDVTLRMALVFRSDLPEMTRAKSEIQACHAACELTHAVTLSDPKLMGDYLSANQPKVNMEVDSLEELLAIAEKAQKRGVNFRMIKDAARTCFAEPTYTCILLGPTTKTNTNALTREARMRDRERQDI